MANYIVQPHSWIEVEGDSMPMGYTDSQSGNEGVIMQPVLTITPDNSANNIGSGAYWEYCISAINFNISGGTSMMTNTDPVTGITAHHFYAGFNGVTLPSEVTSVSFEDTQLGGGIGNTIIVKVTLNPSFEMPPNDYVIDIDIDGYTDTCITQDIGNLKVILTNSLMPDPWHIEDSIFQHHHEGNGLGFNYVTTNSDYNQVASGGGLGNQLFTGVLTGTWSDYKHEQYLQYEKLGLQNPGAIPNCTIVPTNSPVVNGGFSQDNGNTWATECVQWSSNSGIYQNAVWDGETPVGGLPMYFEWKITPNVGKTVAASDFYILQTFHTHVNTIGIGPGCSSPKDMGHLIFTPTTPGGGLGGGDTIIDQWGNTLDALSYEQIDYQNCDHQLLNLRPCRGFGAYGFLAYGPHTYNRWMPVEETNPQLTEADAAGGGWVLETSEETIYTFTGAEWNEMHPLWDEWWDISGEYTLSTWADNYSYPPNDWVGSESLEVNSGWVNNNGDPVGTGNWWDDLTIFGESQADLTTKRRFNSVQLWILSDQGQGLEESGFFGNSNTTVGRHTGAIDGIHSRSEAFWNANVSSHSPTMWGDVTQDGLLRFTSNSPNEYDAENQINEGSIFSPCGCINGDVGDYQGTNYSDSTLYDNDAPFVNGVYTIGPILATMHGGGAAPTVYNQAPTKADGIRPGLFAAYMGNEWWTSYAVNNGISGFANNFNDFGKGVEIVGDTSTFPQGEGFLQWPFWNANVLEQGSFGTVGNIYLDVGSGSEDVPSQYQTQVGSVSNWTIQDETGFLPGGNRDCHINGLARSSWPDNYNNSPARIPWWSWTYPIHPSPSLTPIKPNDEPNGLEALSINKGWAANGIANNYVEIVNTTTPGAADNELLVRYHISDDYSHDIYGDWNTYNKALYIQINGSTNDIEDTDGTIGEGQPSFNFDIVDQHYSHEDTRTVNIISNNNDVYVSSTNVERGGFSDQQDITTLVGKVKSGEVTSIARIKVESKEGRYFAKTPTITGPDKFQAVLRSRESNTSYIFELIYQNTESIFKSDNVKLNLNCKELATVVKTNRIHKVTYGDDLVGESGGSRSICVHGDPETEFELLFTKAIISTLRSDEDGYDEFSDNIISVLEEDILSSYTQNSSITLEDGRVFKQLKQTIGRDGRYYFKQKLPNSTDYTQYKIHIKSDNYGSGILEWDVDAGWEDYYTKTIKQYPDPVLTLKASAGSTYDITHYNNAATGFTGGSDAHSIVRTGKANLTGIDWSKKTKEADSFTVSYIINGISTKHFTASRIPKFSVSYGYDDNNTPTSVAGTPPGFIIKSDWSNTVPKDNGGTVVNITNIRSVLSNDGGTSNGICTLSFRVKIEKWGTKNVTMDLNLDKILTAS